MDDIHKDPKVGVTNSETIQPQRSDGWCAIKDEFLIPEKLVEILNKDLTERVAAEAELDDNRARVKGMNKGRKKEQLGYVDVRSKPKIRPTEALATEFNYLSINLRNALRKRTYDFKTPLSGKRSRKQIQHEQKRASLSETAGQEKDSAAKKQKSVNENGDRIALPQKHNEGGAEGADADTATASLSVDQLDSIAEPTGIDRARVKPQEKKKIDFNDKIYIAPLTTVGNLPYRRIMKKFGADITCGEMALFGGILQGSPSEWALLRRHPCEDIFGVQLAGCYPDTMGRVAEVIENECNVDFVDINMGCPIDLVCKKGMGATLMSRQGKLKDIVQTMTDILSCPLTLKMRMGLDQNKPFADKVVDKVRRWERIAACTLHGRSRAQRYTKRADWKYISQVVDAAKSEIVVDGTSIPSMPIIGNGDIFSWEDWYNNKADTGVATNMLARGALIKPWLPTEIKERRHWDISSRERFDIMKTFCNYGLEHWGADAKGVNRTRRFLLEWQSFLCRYVPVGLLDRIPQHLNDRPPPYVGRDDLETLMASRQAEDWVRLSEMLLGPVPEGFKFVPKHKANSYAVIGGSDIPVSDSMMRAEGLRLVTRARKEETSPVYNGWTFRSVQADMDNLMRELDCPIVKIYDECDTAIPTTETASLAEPVDVDAKSSHNTVTMPTTA